ncbi:MAG: Bax inhibitor-1/YccA family protein [Bdellovibrio sp.]|nr:Bax inhibitor-1/YccA family protein [Bdellovibrio sp.]
MSNPVLNEKTLNKIQDFGATEKMTMEGTMNKSGLLILLTIAGAYIGWNTPSPLMLIVSFIATLVLVFLISFKPERAAYLSQPYALMEGMILGTISSMYSVRYPGIVSNALMLTISCLVLMLGLYRFKIIRVTEKVKSVIMGATLAICLTYVVSMIMGFFGSSIPMIHESSPMGIGFSVLVVGVAAFNLLLDFDFIEQAYQRGAPKYMEWYGGFALLVTIVWLYLEILRLLSKLNKK